MSIVDPAPKTMPLGLISNTWPFDCSVPRITEGFPPTTRFSTALDADCCRKRVISLAPMEKPCQLMIEPGEFVICSRLPLLVNDTWPLMTAAPLGFA